MGVGCGLWVEVWFLRKIRPTQLWVEFSWVVAKMLKIWEVMHIPLKTRDDFGTFPYIVSMRI